MASLRVLLTATAALVCWSMDVSETSTLTFDEAGSKNRPVSKVITLLKDMLKQLEKEQEEDEAIYDKMACWCEVNDKEKTASIKNAENRISDLTTTIESNTATSARLGTEIKNLENEVQKNQEALDKATAIRQKQLAEFNGEEKDLLASIGALKSAIVVLSKHHQSSLVQVPASHMIGVATTIQHEMEAHKDILQGVLSHSDRRVISAFVQSPQDYFDASPTFKQSYAPQSGEIFGILKQMLETFEGDLSAGQKEEMANQKSYEDLKAAKETEIKTGQDNVDAKTQQLADTDSATAQAKEDLEDTQNSLSADEQFLMMLKEKCSMTDKEWELRQKTRQDEMEAVSKALAVLSSDDAHDLFTRTFNPAFVQTEAVSSSRARASKVLSAAAQKFHSPRLATMAVQVRLDAFTRVKKAIDDMIAELLKEKEDEIKHKDFCVDEFNQNQLQTEAKEREKEDLLARIASLESKITQLTAEIDTAKAEIAENEKQMKRAGEDREMQNKEFQTTVADQRATQKLLAQALNVLKSFYAKNSALVQEEPVGPPPPAGFKKYEKNAAAGGVMGMIQTIINDAKAQEADTIRSEEDSQKAYEDFVKNTNSVIEKLSKQIVNLTKVKATKEGDLVTAKEDKDATLFELEQLSNYNAELHASCDFVLKNFDIRQTARDEEVEALRQAKAILSGADFTALLQSS